MLNDFELSLHSSRIALGCKVNELVELVFCG